MPAAYTHFKFGQEVLFHLSNKKLREVIAHYPKMFDLGLYGPDILFYHGIPGKKELNYLGFSLHKEKAADFFVYAKDIIMEENVLREVYNFCYDLSIEDAFVFELYLNGYSRQSISFLLNVSYKRTSYLICKIKDKLKKYLSKTDLLVI